MAGNPFKHSRQEDDRRQGAYSLGVAEVVGVPPDAGHQIAIQPVTKTGSGSTETRPSNATAIVPQKGDIALPNRGDLVLFGRLKNRQHVVLGTIYSQQSDIRDYQPDERHVGQDDGDGTWIHGPFGVVPKRDSAPADPPDGSVWYRTDLGQFRGIEGGTKVRFDTTAV